MPAVDPELASLKDELKNLKDSLKKAERTPAAKEYNPAPAVRVGEDPLSSRPLYVSKLAAHLTGRLGAEQCKPELEGFGWFTKAMRDVFGGGYTHEDGVLVPMDWRSLPGQVTDAGEGRSFRKALAAAEGTYDPDELAWALRKASNPMSYIDQAYGGAFIPPPAFGEPIDLLRNKAACFQAGATSVPLPPQGSITYPRQTTATDAFWEGENTDATTEQRVGTGDVTLAAKQLKAFGRVPNQWLRFAPGAADALVRNDMTISVQLKIDKAALEGPGGPGVPKGLLSYKGETNGITSYTGTLAGSGTANDPYLLKAADADLMISKLEEANADISGWVMAPKMWRSCFKQLRADAVSAGDNAGRFIFDPQRTTGEDLAERLLGYKVVRSNQVSTARTRGSANGLSYVLAGMWSDLLIGMHGAMELVANDKGDEAFKKNQTLLRAIAFADVGLRRGASFVVYDQVKLALS